MVGLPAALADDYGDGAEACNNGEICEFDYVATGSARYTKHWWYSSTEYSKTGGGYYMWWDTTLHVGTGWHVYDDVSSVRNRDSVCEVTFYPQLSFNGNGWPLDNNGTRTTVVWWIDPDQQGADGISSHLRCAG